MPLNFRVVNSKMKFLCLPAAIFFIAAFPSQGSAIMCYDCNSQFDPNCGDPFNDYTIALVNCSTVPPPEHLDSVNSTICRKTVQLVMGQTRIIRRCGYITDADRDDKACVMRSGTFEVQLNLCSCSHDRCNSSTISEANQTLELLAILFLITASIRPFRL